jgi:hypothetical protein
MLQCGGCRAISLARQTLDVSDGHITKDYYPSPASRRKPEWLANLSPFWITGEEFAGLLEEIYAAIDGGQHRLAAMGIRALLERLMITKVGDLETFGKKLDAFQHGGYISLLQRDAMANTLEMGHAAMHRAFRPSESELNIAMDIVESVFGVIYEHSEQAENLIKRVPPRAPKPKKTSQS